MAFGQYFILIIATVWGAAAAGFLIVFRIVGLVGSGDTTLGSLIHGFWADRKSSIFGVRAAPAAPKPLPTSGREAAQRLEGICGPPGPPGLQKSTISGRPKTYVSKTLV